MRDKLRVGERSARLSRQRDAPFVYRADQSSAREHARRHRPPEELMP